jgi:predicted CoA-binding protein
MTTQNDSISQLLNSASTIAVVGLSPNKDRPSHEVAEYLQRHGYRIIPVNPTYAGTNILGEHCYATLKQAKDILIETGVKIDIVDCFRRPEYIDEVATEAINIHAQCLWMQLGIINEAAAAKAEKAGLVVVMNRCIKAEHLLLHAKH